MDRRGPRAHTFNDVKELKFGDKTVKAILAEGKTYQIKSFLTDQGFKFETELGMWARFYEDNTPEIDDEPFTQYGWVVSHEVYDDAATPDDVS